MLFKREISRKIRRLAEHFPAIVVTGARQTGKTTLLRELFPAHTYVTLDLPRNAQMAEEAPEEFLRRFSPPLLIDEIQYAPALFRHLKVAIDQDREKVGAFVLTGSQKFNLMKEVSDSLAGRCGIVELETLSCKELGDTLLSSLKSHSNAWHLSRGFYPQLWKDSQLLSSDFYSSYIATYLERDVRQILNVSSLRDFERFMRACAVRSGQLVNKTEIGKETGVTSVTANEWLSVLHSSNQVTLLEPFFGNIGKRLIKSPKLYFNDPGLLCFLLGLTSQSLEASYSIGGVWETFVFGELKKNLMGHFPQTKLWFYRDPTQEIDFLIDIGGRITAVETKWTEIPSQKDFATLQAVTATSSIFEKKCYVVCRTEQSFPIAKNCIALNGFRCHEFVQEVTADLSLE
ncbi:MAG: ATP-binding protein [Deltaproteobacteria bacterium]|nr:ATP-binding protein [Deltaproteobacteria bacterium]